jgi:hypothetical protein
MHSWVRSQFLDHCGCLFILAAAHRQAWEKGEVLHRDISVGNILINVEGDEDDPQGFLNDWDLAKTLEALLACDGPSQPVGISVSLLQRKHETTADHILC